MSYLSFTKQKNKTAKGVFINRCFIVALAIAMVLVWMMLGNSGCSHTPIKINVDPAAKILTEEAISYAGYLVGKKYPAESGVALAVADVMLQNSRPLQDVVNEMVSNLGEFVSDEYLRMRCERLLDNLDIKINPDGLILVEESNELIESALYSFLDGLRASQGEVN